MRYILAWIYILFFIRGAGSGVEEPKMSRPNSVKEIAECFQQQVKSVRINIIVL